VFEWGGEKGGFRRMRSNGHRGHKEKRIECLLYDMGRKTKERKRLCRLYAGHGKEKKVKKEKS